MKFLQLFPQRRKKTLNQKLLNVTKKTSVQIELISSSPPPSHATVDHSASISAATALGEEEKEEDERGAVGAL